jgi:hypothetical protein
MAAFRFLHAAVGHSQKVDQLTDLAYRVWTQYLLSADDFGVMRATAVTVQAQNRTLARHTVEEIDACLEQLLAVGLVGVFPHQGERFFYQPDWQDFQRLAWPAKTLNPAIPVALRGGCSPATLLLLTVYPGGRRVPSKSKLLSEPQKTAVEAQPENSGSTSEVLQKYSETPPKVLSNNFLPEALSLKAKAKDKANAKANDREGTGEGTAALPPMDEWALELVERYPAKGRCAPGFIERHLFAVLTAKYPQVSYAEAWAALLASLERQIASHQWRVDGRIPRLDNWLQAGLYLQELPAEGPPSATSREPAWIRKARESTS